MVENAISTCSPLTKRLEGRYGVMAESIAKVLISIEISAEGDLEERSTAMQIKTTTGKPAAIKPSEPAWQPLDLKAVIKKQLSEIREKAEAAAIKQMELRRELRLIGR
jgi:hypothetical protein